MVILNDLYRSKKMSSYEDNYGGNVFNNYYYSYLLFRYNNVFLFSSSPMFSSSKIKPITSFDDSKTIKNIEIILKNASTSTFENIETNTVIFNLPVQIVNEQGGIFEVNRIYNAIFEQGNMFLKLKAWNESTPDELIVTEEFEQISPY